MNHHILNQEERVGLFPPIDSAAIANMPDPLPITSLLKREEQQHLAFDRIFFEKNSWHSRLSKIQKYRKIKDLRPDAIKSKLNRES
jgi:hypothetical protein